MSDLSYTFSSNVRDLTPVLQVVMEKNPSILSIFGTSKVARNVKHEWANLPMTSPESPLSGNHTIGATTVNVDDGTKFTIGGQITFKDSAYEVRTISNIVANALTVDALTANHADDVVVLQIAKPELEASAFSATSSTAATIDYNYTQIFKKDVLVSGSQVAMKLMETVDDVVDYAVMQQMIQLYRNLSNAAIFGGRALGSATTVRTMGGLFYYLTQSTALKYDKSAATLTSTMVNDAVAAVFEKGGNPDVIACGPAAARKITGFQTATANQIVFVDAKDMTAGSVAGLFQGDLVGTAVKRIVVDSNIPAGNMLILDSSRLDLVPLAGRAMSDKEISIGYDGISRQIVGEYTIEVRDALNAHALIYNFA